MRVIGNRINSPHNAEQSQSEVPTCKYEGNPEKFLVEEVEKIFKGIKPHSNSFHPGKAGSHVNEGMGVLNNLLSNPAQADILAGETDLTGLWLESAPHPLCLINADFSIMYANSAWESLSGYNRSEIFGKKTPYPWWPQEKIGDYQTSDFSAENLGSNQFTRQYRKKSGEDFWVISRIKAIIEKEELKWYLVIWEDITEKKRAHDELLISQNCFYQIFENVTSGIAVYEEVEGGEDFILKNINRSGERSTGLKKSEVINRRVTEVFPGVANFGLLETLKSVKRTGIPEFKPMGLYSDGRLSFWAENQVFPLASGEIVAVFDDITERKNAEKQIQESQDNFRKLVQQSPLPITYCNEQGKIEFVNSQFTSTFGYTLEDIPDLKTWNLKAAPDENYRREMMREETEVLSTLSSGKKPDKTYPPSETKITCKNGSTRLAETYLSVIGTRVMAVFVDITERKKVEEELRRADLDLKNSLRESKKALYDYIETTVKIIEMRDPYTAGHQQKVAYFCEAIGKKMNLPDSQIESIRLAARVHDIGKIYVPAEILCKTGSLDETEYSLVKTHVQRGYDTLKNIDFPWPIAQIILQHHERLDGSGYPNGLKQEDILLEARLIAVADTLDAMSTHRPYRPAKGVAEALSEICRGKGTLFDEKVVEACCELFYVDGFDGDKPIVNDMNQTQEIL
jgi:PAS domain S-box-containing protein